MPKCLNVNMTKGFTLMEAIVAIFLLTVGIIGVSILITNTISSTRISTDKLIASYLAQEGIEIVRNIRDTNWLEGAASWDDGISVGDYEADYTNTQGFYHTCSFNPFTANCEYDNLHPLRIDGGFYNYSGGTETKLRRRITIFDKTDLSSPADGTIDMFKISVLVTWQEKGKIHEVEAQENLYNWK